MPPSPPVTASSAVLMAVTTAAAAVLLAIVTLTALPPLRPVAWIVKVPPVKVPVVACEPVRVAAVAAELSATLTGVVPTAPPEKVRFLTVPPAVIAAASCVYDTPLNDLSWRAERMFACMVSIVREIEVMALSAASRVLMPFDMPSRSEERSLPRRLRLAAVKKFVGLSRAELTFLPVARRS